MPPNDDQPDERIRAAAPRAPRDFAAQVMARVERTAVVRARRRRVAFGAGVSIAAAAAVVLLIARGGPRSGGGGPSAIAGLSSIAPGHVTVERDARGVVRAGTLWLTGGRARLRGDGARVETEVALVVTLGEEADVEVELQGRTDMGKTTKTIGGVVAVGAAVLSVYVLRGAARVEARPAGSGAPTLLAAGDRAIRMSGAPLLALRAGLGQHDDDHARPRADTPVVPPLPSGTLDKEVIRTSIQAVIPKITECYEQALAKNPTLGGRIVLSFRIKNVDGKGKIDEAEVIPSEGKDDLDSPATEHCLLQVVAGAEFPAPAGGDVQVTYPFVLMAGPPDDDEPPPAPTPRSTK